MTTHVFIESIDLTEATLDTDNRVLSGVVLIRAGESANKREYPADVLQASVPVFEGVKAFRDHPTRTQLKERGERSISDITGFYANVRYSGDKLIADRHFTTNEAGKDAWALAEMVASGNAPKSLAGLSINAVGQARKRDDGGVVVESITYAHSVDDVTTPAAGGSYIESVSSDAMLQALVETLTYEEWLTICPAYVEQFQEEHRKTRRNAELRHALSEADKYRARCDVLETENVQLQEARNEAVAQAEQLQRAVLVERALKRVSLPAQWRESLYTQLMEANPESWGAIIDNELSKAKSANMQPKVTVTGAGQRVANPPVLPVVENLAVRDDETPEQWRRRVEAARKQR